MSVVFKMHIDVIPQNVEGVTHMEQDLDTSVATLMESISKVHIFNLKKYVHVWEPKKKGTHMRDEIRETGRGKDWVEITVQKPYAKRENERQGTKPGHGPHNFADQAERDTAQQFANLGTTAINNVIKRNKVRIVVL